MIPPALLQFAGSLVAIVVLAWVAARLGLGPAPRIADEAAARDAAESAVPGFHPVAIGLDRTGAGALLRDASGRILLLRPHGAHLAGRLLGPGAGATLRGDRLIVDPADPRFGSASLDLAEPSPWVQAIAAIGARDNA